MMIFVVKAYDQINGKKIIGFATGEDEINAGYKFKSYAYDYHGLLLDLGDMTIEHHDKDHCAYIFSEGE